MASAALQALLISPDSERRCELHAVLVRCGVNAVLSTGLADAQARLRHSHPFDLVLCEDTLPDASLPDVLRTLKAATAETPVVVCSPFGDFPEYLEAMECGAFDFIVPPYRTADVQCIVSSILGQSSRKDRKRIWAAAGSASA